MPAYFLQRQKTWENIWQLRSNNRWWCGVPYKRRESPLFKFSKAVREGVRRCTMLRSIWDMDYSGETKRRQDFPSLRVPVSEEAERKWNPSLESHEWNFHGDSYQKSTQNWPELDWDLGCIPRTSRWPITPQIFASFISTRPPPLRLPNWKNWALKLGREGINQDQIILYPTPNLLATNLVYWGDGGGVGRRSSNCDLSPYEIRVLNRPRLLVKGLAHFQDVLKE